MTPRSKRYFTDKYFLRLFPKNKTIMQVMIEMAKPILKYPPGTIHPGGPAIVGEGGPELILRPGQIAIVGEGDEQVMVLPSGAVIYPGKITSEMIEKPVADMTKEINRRMLADIIGRASGPIVTDATF